MLAIKLRPIGKKKQKSFRIVVIQKHTKLVGKFVEDIGWYNPHTNQRVVKSERAQYWIGQGAQPTDTVHNIFISEGVLAGKKRSVHAQSKKQQEQAQEQQAPVSAPKEIEGTAPSQEVASEPEVVPEPKEQQVSEPVGEEPKEENS